MSELGKTATHPLTSPELKNDGLTRIAEGNFSNFIEQIAIIRSFLNQQNYSGTDHSSRALKNLQAGFELVGRALSAYQQAYMRDPLNIPNIANYQQPFLRDSRIKVSEVVAGAPALCQHALDLFARAPEVRNRVDKFIKSVSNSEIEVPAQDIFATWGEPGMCWAWSREKETMYRELFAQIGGIQGAERLIAETQGVLQALGGSAKPSGIWAETLRLADSLLKLCQRGNAASSQTWVTKAPKGIPESGSGFELSRGGAQPRSGRPDIPA